MLTGILLVFLIAPLFVLFFALSFKQNKSFKLALIIQSLYFFFLSLASYSLNGKGEGEGIDIMVAFVTFVVCSIVGIFGSWAWYYSHKT
ncbi:hypothetical protein C7H09_09365 [Marinobacter fuscus]|uniref:Uncharacterized protein n=2 Tax=Marinobacter fuscus TaxID=2109942 RepID=A0A2T1KDT2_9GAMM|nr:hypothetical protein C7H09_09365 [Marinobacter fuscus]